MYLFVYHYFQALPNDWAIWCSGWTEIFQIGQPFLLEFCCSVAAFAQQNSNQFSETWLLSAETATKDLCDPFLLKTLFFFDSIFWVHTLELWYCYFGAFWTLLSKNTVFSFETKNKVFFSYLVLLSCCLRQYINMYNTMTDWRGIIILPSKNGLINV